LDKAVSIADHVKRPAIPKENMSHVRQQLLRHVSQTPDVRKDFNVFTWAAAFNSQRVVGPEKTPSPEKAVVRRG
jgi:hypothetical protein